MVTADESSRDMTVVGTRYLTALAQRDWAAVEAFFDAGLRFRALIPPGLREATDRATAVGHLRRWFGDADDLVVVSAEASALPDRLSLSYRFRVHEDGAWYVVEQRAYCVVSEGRIRGMDLLCAGFHVTSGAVPAPPSR